VTPKKTSKMDVSNLHTGSYRTFLAYRKAEVIYDMTYYFCRKYLKCGDRTIDQMVQAARSGKQNIIEGKEAARTSYETLLKLINVARSSLQELLADYEDYLRVRNLKLWPKESVEVKAMRKLGCEHKDSEFFLSLAETRNDEVVANMVIVLICQADVLLDRYGQKQKEKFLKEGGFRENLTKERLEYRNNKG
jgi:four helix bundle suffix protein